MLDVLDHRLGQRLRNRPTRFTAGVNVLLRIAITSVLACGTYPLYYFVLAPHVRHDPASVGTLHGVAAIDGPRALAQSLVAQ